LAKEAEAERLHLEQKEAERKAATEAQVDARPEKGGEIDEDGDTSPAATQDSKDKTFASPPPLSGIQGILTSLTRRRPTFQLLRALLPLLV